jgi:hypothetical protein
MAQDDTNRAVFLGGRFSDPIESYEVFAIKARPFPLRVGPASETLAQLFSEQTAPIIGKPNE